MLGRTPPSRIAEVLRIWKADLAHVNQTAAEALADPVEHSDHEDFADLKIALSIEKMNASSVSKVISASNYFQVKERDAARLDCDCEREGGSIESKVSSSVNSTNSLGTETKAEQQQPPAPEDSCDTT